MNKIIPVLRNSFNDTIEYCEDPKNRIIRDCEFGDNDGLVSVYVTSSIDGEFAEKSFKLFDFFSDEISFSKSEIVGKTEANVLKLYGEKDRAYLSY